MKNKIIIIFILLVSLFTMCGFGVALAVDSSGQATRSEDAGVNPANNSFESMFFFQDIPGELEQNIQNIMPDYDKKIGLLPDSNFYFFKRLKETMVGWSKFGDKKNEYRIDLTSKRLIEVYLVLKKNNIKKANSALNDYHKIMGKIDDSYMISHTEQILENYQILTGLRNSHFKSALKAFDDSYTKTDKIILEHYKNKQGNYEV